MTRLPTTSEFRTEHRLLNLAGVIALARGKVVAARSVAARQHWRAVVRELVAIETATRRRMRALERQARANARRLAPKAPMTDAVKGRLREKQAERDATREVLRAARRAEVAEARVVASIFLDALIEHDAARVTWFADPDSPKTGPGPSKLDALIAAHEADWRQALRDRDGMPPYADHEARPLAMSRDLRGALLAVALEAYKLDHPRARGYNHHLFRSSSTNPRAHTTGWHACRYCGAVLNEPVRMGDGVTQAARDHAELCALQYLAGIRVALAPGERPATYHTILGTSEAPSGVEE